MQVDAFTRIPLGGNPCAIVFDADELSDDTMQALAREMNLSETAFVLRSDVADVRARYFTPSEEIPLAGHPTIATIFALAETERIPPDGERTRVSLELRAGIVTVDILSHDGVPDSVIMTQPRPQFLDCATPEEAATAFGLSSADLHMDGPVQVVSTGTPQLMVPLVHLDALHDLSLDLDALTVLRARYQFFSAHLFVLESEGTFARHFACPPDVFEDPFTGSATGGMGAYLWHYKLLNTPSFTARQGHWMQRPGEATVTVLGPRDNISGVQVGGSAVTIVRSELVL